MPARIRNSVDLPLPDGPSTATNSRGQTSNETRFSACNPPLLSGKVALKSRTVKIGEEMGISKEVEGKTYSDVVFIEAGSKLNMNGNIIPMNFLTQYYYAKGVGLALTTSSVGDAMPLTAYELK